MLLLLLLFLLLFLLHRGRQDHTEEEWRLQVGRNGVKETEENEEEIR